MAVWLAGFSLLTDIILFDGIYEMVANEIDSDHLASNAKPL